MTTDAMNLRYYQTVMALEESLAKISDQINLLKQSSAEVLINYQDNLQNTLQQLSQSMESYKRTLEKMPKEIRKRDFVKQMLAQVNAYENDVKRYLNNLKINSKFDWQTLSVRFNERIQQFNHQIELLNQNTLIQKFLRDEVILGSRTTIQWGRKFSHVSLGLFFWYLFILADIPHWILTTITTVFFIWAFGLESLRHVNVKVNDWVCIHFRGVMRESEKTKINSAIFYILSISTIYLVFPLEVTQLCLLHLAFGDTVAGVVGVYWGKTKLTKNSSVEGFTACILTCTTITYLLSFFLFGFQLNWFALTIFSLLTGIIAAISEISFSKLDDNLVMPILSAPIIWMLMHFFHLL